MSQLARVLIACLASGLFVVTGGPTALGQAQDDDTVTPSATSPGAVLARIGDTRSENDLDSFLRRLDRQSQQIEQLQKENRRLSEGLERLGKVPAMGVAYRALGETGQGDLAAKVGTLWGEMPIWLPYIEASFRGGSVIDRGELDLFMPLIWSDTSLLFADLRGSIGDRGHHEGNWALASRQLTDADRILGIWGSYDLRESETGNHFDQAAFGIEVLSYEKDFRLNGYVPTNLDPKLVPGGTVTAAISGDNLVVNSNQELAYWGLDGEFGRLLWSNDPGVEEPEDEGHKWYTGLDAELRGFVGGYYFDNPTAGFDEIAGPRVRAELRMYDLELLGDGSRLTLEGLIQNDGVRGTQAEAGLYVRIPLGPRPGRRLDRMQRRMVDRIVRDADVVADHRAIEEAANFASNGLAINFANVVNARNDLSDAVSAAGVNSLAVVDGSAGEFSESDTTVLSAGQAVLGGGGTLAVVGRETGTPVVFTAPGTRPQVTGTDPANDVFQIADDSSLAGLDINGGQNGVYGDSVTGFTLRDLEASGATNDGFHLTGTNSGTISGNTASGNAASGFGVDNLVGGTISGNTSTANSDQGFAVASFSGGTMSGNTATSNFIGFKVEDFSGGTLSGNAADSNSFGFYIDNFTSGTMSDNAADSNSFGVLVNDFTGGTLSGNAANSNSDQGFLVADMNGGTLSGNTATDNDEDGFYVQNFNSGTMSGNSAVLNTDRGFLVKNFSGGMLSGNTAISNTQHGFAVENFSGGTMSGNTSNSNSENGFNVEDFNGGTLSGNTATSNDAYGFNVEGFSGGTLSGNTATSNDSYGFNVEDFSGGTLSGNTATSNETFGFRVANFSGGTMSGNSDVSDDFSGFRVAAFNGGTLSGNSATSSAFGFWITDFSSGTVSDNTSNSNSLGFLLDGEVSGGTLSGNTASSNSHDGFSAVNISGGTMSGNTATSNGEDGFDFGGSDPSSGDGFTASNTATFESNESSNNTAQGYDIEGTPQTGAGTNTGSGNGSDDSF